MPSVWNVEIVGADIRIRSTLSPARNVLVKELKRPASSISSERSR